MSETVKKTATKTSAAKDAGVSDTEKDLRSQLEASQALIAEMKAMMETMRAQQTNVVTPTAVAPTYIAAPSTDVTLVYTSTSPGFLVVEGAGLTLNCTQYGETFVLSRSQLDALVGKYRNWFRDGRLALSNKDVKVAAEKGVATVGEFALSADKLSKLGTMSVSELEKLWNSITYSEQRLSLVLYYKRKFIEGVEPGYQDRSKIDLLNRLTDNGFSREAIEVSGINTKILPTDLL